MSFSKRKSDRRKPDVRPLAASAEVCEARALLSADGAAVTVEEIVDTKSDDANTVDVENGDGEIVPEIAICEFVPEIAICTMLPLEQEFVSDGEGEVIKGEELLWTCGWPVDGEIVDALPVDEFVGEEEFVDITTLEDWDPSWAYRSFVVDDSKVIVDKEVVDTNAVDAESVDGEIVPEIAICTMLPLAAEFVSEGEVVEGEELLYTCGLPVDEQIRHALPVDEFIREEEFVSITSFEDWDPSWAYTSFLVDDVGAEVVDGDGEVIVGEETVVGEEEFVDVTTLEDWDPWAYRRALPVYELAGEEEFVDVTTLEDWDPSWAYRFLGVPDDVVVDEEIAVGDVPSDVVDGEEEFVDVTMLEEWDPSWAYRGVVVEEEFSTTDDFETVTDDVTDEDVIFYTLGVLEKEVDGDVVVDDSEESTEATDGEEVVDEVQDSEELTESELHDLIRYDMAPNFRGNSGIDGIVASNAGGIMTESPEVTAAEVMGPVASGGPVLTSVSMPAVNVPVAVPVTSVVPVSASIPVSFSSFQPLFETRQEIDNIGTLIAQLPDDSSVSSELSEVAVSSGLESGLGQTQSDALDSLDSDLEVLDTILDGDAAESESEITSEPVDVEVAPEEPVTTAKETVPVTDATVVASARPVRHSSDRLMDRFMTEFAVNGFAG